MLSEDMSCCVKNIHVAEMETDNCRGHLLVEYDSRLGEEVFEMCK